MDHDFLIGMIARWAGSLALAGILTRLFKKKFERTRSKGVSIIFSYLISAGLIGIVTYFTIGLVESVFWYLPAMFFWLIYDLINLNKMSYTEKKDKKSNNISAVIKKSNKVWYWTLLLGILIGIVTCLLFFTILALTEKKNSNQNLGQVSNVDTFDRTVSFMDSLDRLFWRKFASTRSFLGVMSDEGYNISALSEKRVDIEEIIEQESVIASTKIQARNEREKINDSLRTLGSMEMDNLEEHNILVASINLLSHLEKSLNYYPDYLDAKMCFLKREYVRSPSCESDIDSKLKSTEDYIVEEEILKDTIEDFFGDVKEYCEKNSSQSCIDKLNHWITKNEEIKKMSNENFENYKESIKKNK